MKRLLVISLAALIALAAAAPAQAKFKHLTGSVSGGGTVSIYVFVKTVHKGKKKRHVPTFVDETVFTGLPTTCDQGPSNRLLGTHNPASVSGKGKFSYTFQGFNGSFSGKVTKGGTKIVDGKVSYGPNDVTNPPGYTNCSTGGSRSWSAHN